MTEAWFLVCKRAYVCVDSGATTTIVTSEYVMVNKIRQDHG